MLSKMNGNVLKTFIQIVGLTASIGVGRSSDEKGALEHLIRICALLDVKVLSTVVKNREELEKYITSVQESKQTNIFNAALNMTIIH